MSQGQIFSRAGVRSVVPGFSMLLEYMTPEQEKELLAQVASGPWDGAGERREQRFGLEFSDAGGVWVRDLPLWLLPLAKRVCHDGDFARFPENCVVSELTAATKEEPRQDDARFGPIVAGVSLGMDAILELVSEDGRRQVPIHLPARTFWAVGDEARAKWLYSLTPKGEGKVVSVVFRTVADLQVVLAARRRK